MPHAKHSSDQASGMIRITGMGDHDRLEWMIRITGIRTVFAACGCATALPTRIVLFRTVPAFCAPLTGSSSDSRSATLPNGASTAYRAVT